MSKLILIELLQGGGGDDGAVAPQASGNERKIIKKIIWHRIVVF